MICNIEGGVTAAQGFQAASTAAGIKYKDRQDMALIYSQVPCVAAGTFTVNVVKAAPVLWETCTSALSTPPLWNWSPRPPQQLPALPCTSVPAQSHWLWLELCPTSAAAFA